MHPTALCHACCWKPTCRRPRCWRAQALNLTAWRAPRTAGIPDQISGGYADCQWAGYRHSPVRPVGFAVRAAAFSSPLGRTHRRMTVARRPAAGQRSRPGQQRRPPLAARRPAGPTVCHSLSPPRLRRLAASGAYVSFVAAAALRLARLLPAAALLRWQWRVPCSATAGQQAARLLAFQSAVFYTAPEHQ